MKTLTEIEQIDVDAFSFYRPGKIPHLFYRDALADSTESENDLEDNDHSHRPFGEPFEGRSHR
jgi:hypothetical protein